MNGVGVIASGTVEAAEAEAAEAGTGLLEAEEEDGGVEVNMPGKNSNKEG